jgi:Tfp pilus assembly protein PilZ
MRHREAVRIVPRSPITVAIQDGGVPYAYGVVANISEGGACIWTDVSLEPGRDVSLRLSFPRGSQPLDARGLVVWCEPRDGESRRYGLQWRDRSPARTARLKTVIATSST